MKFIELKDKTRKELVEELKKLKKEALNLRFQKVIGELSNTAQLRRARKDVARIKTALHQS